MILPIIKGLLTAFRRVLVAIWHHSGKCRNQTEQGDDKDDMADQSNNMPALQIASILLTESSFISNLQTTIFFITDVNL